MRRLMRDTIFALKTALHVVSDYELAQRLGVTRQCVSAWQRGLANPDDLIAFRIALLLNRDPAKLIAEINLERAKRADQRKKWKGVIAQLSVETKRKTDNTH